MEVLLVDNYDSYTYNLFQLLATTYGTAPQVVYNDAPELRTVDLDRFDAIVVSPGPGRPQVPRDMGVVLELVERAGLPTLGVCLGHQALALLSGGDVVAAPQPRHGHLERIAHVGTDLFAGLPQSFVGVRYHSLCVPRPLPAKLRELAWSADGVVMALRRVDLPWWGVQFHPESIATEHGALLLENFARLAGASRWRTRTPPRTAVPDHVPARNVHRRTRRVIVRSVDHEVDTELVHRELFAGSPHAFWLDSSRVEAGLSRFSFLGSSEGSLAELLCYDVERGMVEIRRGSGDVERRHATIFDTLDEALAASRPASPPDLPFDFDGGYVGYLGYELKRDCGSPNAHTSPLPDAMWMSATRLVTVDHENRRTWLVAMTDDDDLPAAQDWLDSAYAFACHAIAGSTRATAQRTGLVDPEPWLDRDRSTYLSDVEACLSKLRAGESYEICLTNTVRLPFSGDARDLYYRQRAANPAPYAALLRFGDTYVLCSSPERFLRIDRDRIAESKPIKGTIRRGSDNAEDDQLRKQLTEDDKTRAENLMIVDLVRNDLGRVCDIDSVTVPRFMTVESYSTMHQLVSTVRGHLQDGVTPVRAARACFPGGSMTGAPKLRTMEILDGIERRARGVYSGAIGYFGLCGTADLNIVIRTAVVHRNQLYVGAGGAIVLDSDPADEYHEMLLKAQAPLRGLHPEEIAGQP